MDIGGLNKARILAALYNRTILIAPMAMVTGAYTPGDMSLEEAQMIIDERIAKGLPLTFDYLKGRMLKVDIGRSSDQLDLSLYDRDNGPGAGEEAILEELTG